MVRKLTFEDILAAEDLETHEVFVPQWDGVVQVRSWTKATEMKMRAEAKDPATGVIDSEELEMLMLVYGVVDPELTREMIPALRVKSSAAVDIVLKEIMAVNAQTPDAIKKAAGTFQGEPGAEAPVPAGPGPGDDGGQAQDGADVG